jgi:hypothetical protein
MARSHGEPPSGLTPEAECLLAAKAVRFLDRHRLGPTITARALYAKYLEDSISPETLLAYCEAVVEGLMNGRNHSE